MIDFQYNIPQLNTGKFDIIKRVKILLFFLKKIYLQSIKFRM